MKYLHSTAESAPISSATRLSCPGGTKRQNHNQATQRKKTSPKGDT